VMAVKSTWDDDDPTDPNFTWAFGDAGVDESPAKPPDASDDIARRRDEHFWPHKGGCPICGSDAYVGFSSVECSNGGCPNFGPRGAA
jgi:hypothetical protein